MNRKSLKAMLRRHEGEKLKVYKDSLGILTIGIGRNLEAKGLTPSEAEFLCDNDITEIWKTLTTALGFFGSLNDVRQNVLIDMAFMGVQKILPPGASFPKMLAALEAADFDKAADEMLDSTWAKQVGKRAVELANLMRTGVE